MKLHTFHSKTAIQEIDKITSHLVVVGNCHNLKSKMITKENKTCGGRHLNPN